MLFYLAQPSILIGIALAVVLGFYLGSATTVLVARLLGDPMGLRSGRLGLQPAKHASIFSAIAILLVGSGWSEPVVLNDRWRARRFHVAVAVLARPVMYALLCLASLGGVRALTKTVSVETAGRVVDLTSSGGFAGDVLLSMAATFASLCIVSLIPCPPTDLGRAIFTLGGQSPGWQNARYQIEERNFGVGIVLLLLLLPILLNIPSPPQQLAPPLVHGFAALIGLTSLS